MAHSGVLYIFERWQAPKRRGARGNLPPSRPSGRACAYDLFLGRLWLSCSTIFIYSVCTSQRCWQLSITAPV